MRKNQLSSQLKILELPKDLVKQILLKLTNVRDVIHFLQTAKELQPVYNDKTFWKLLCQQYYPYLKLHKNDNFRAVFIEEYKNRQYLKSFVQEVEKMMASLKGKLKNDNATKKLIHSDLKELKNKNNEILYGGGGIDSKYFYILHDINEALNNKEYANEKQQIDVLFKHMDTGPSTSTDTDHKVNLNIR